MRYCVEKKGSFKFCFQSFDKYECEEYASANNLRWASNAWSLSLSEDEEGNPEDVMILVVEDKGDDVDILISTGEVVCENVSPAKLFKFLNEFKVPEEGHFRCYENTAIELRPLIAPLQAVLECKIRHWAKKNRCVPGGLPTRNEIMRRKKEEDDENKLYA